MMKRIHIAYCVASALAFLACACSGTTGPDTLSGSELAFSPAVSSPSTKAIFSGTLIPTDDESAFSVSAVSLNGEQQTLYFFNKTVAYDGSKWGFIADPSTGIAPRYYWPLAGGMNFYAFYPESGMLTSYKIIVPETDPGTGLPENVPVIGGGGIVYKNYTIKHSHGPEKDYEPIEDDKEKNDLNMPNAYVDFLSAAQLYDDVNARTSSTVPLVFNHNLSRIRFRAIAARDLSKKSSVTSEDGTSTFDVVNHVDFTVDSIELLNIYSTATYHSIAPHWRDLKAKYNYFPLTRAEMGTGTALKYGDGEIGSREPIAVDIEKDGGEPADMLLIPQSLTDAKMKVWFSVRQKTVRNEGGTGEFVVNDYTETYIRTIDIAPLIKEFKISTCVTFLFRIDLKEIKLSVSYSDWNSEGEITPVI